MKMINLFKTLPLEDFDSEVKRYWVLKKSDMEESEGNNYLRSKL